MQTILGAGGAIATEIAKALTGYTNEIRLVSRNPHKVNTSDSLFPADLTSYEQTLLAVKGSKVVYLTVGLPYNTKIWKNDWPVIMNNVINACLENNSRLVFFDNMYIYDGKDLDPITEKNSINPPSQKGAVRLQVIEMLWKAEKERGLQALVARCADFYGPSVKKVSLLTETVFKPLSKRKTASLLMSDSFKHSFTYTVDAGKATAMLGNTVEAFGETWHLPTAKNPLTGKEWVEAVAAEFGVKPRYRIANKFLVKLMGTFIPVMKESVEMLYQYDRNYVFNSDKFESKFTIMPTPYQKGIREIINTDYSQMKG